MSGADILQVRRKLDLGLRQIAASLSERLIERGKSRAAGERELKKTDSELTKYRL
jgi:hypothetical protein